MIEKLNGMPEAAAKISGTKEYPEIQGMVYFFEVYGGTIVLAEIYGLPDDEWKDVGKFFGFHIHEGGRCAGERPPLSETGEHYNPNGMQHPFHAGDLPPLLSVDGTAWYAVYMGRFHPDDVVGKTVVIHDGSDDFQTQPSGNSGAKIACGVIREQEGYMSDSGQSTR